MAEVFADTSGWANFFVRSEPFHDQANGLMRQGMSVTVTLYPAQKSDVLIVPNAAISVLGGRHVVTVVADDGSQEQRGITTGISDWQNTEVVDGLSEGEVVVVPEGAVSTDQFRGPGGTFFMGGGGGPRG